jgi:hypothetical protein
MGLDDLQGNLETGSDAEIKKAMREELSKAKGKATLEHKSVQLESAENGFIVRVNEEWSFDRTEKEGRGYKFMHKNYIFPDIDKALPKVKDEMATKIGTEISMSALKDMMGQKAVKVRAVSKGMRTFVVGEGDGHLHFATGEIVDVKEGDQTRKIFKGETLPDKMYGKYGQSNDPDSDATLAVKATLKPHSHKFEIKLTKDNEAGCRIYGTTDIADKHTHQVDILDLVTNFVS